MTCSITENGCLPYKMALGMLTTLPGFGSRGYLSQVLGVLNAFLPVSVLSHSTLEQPEGRQSFCCVLGQNPPLSVGCGEKGAWMEPSPLIPAVLYLGRVCFPAVGNQLVDE